MADAPKTEVLNGDQPLESLKEALPAVAADSETSTLPSSPSAARPASSKSSPLLEQFRTFSKFGDPKADGKTITLSQSDKWMKQAKVIDKKITSTDTGIYFKKFKSLKLSFPDYKKFLEELAKAKKVDVEEILEKMISCGPPGTSGTTSAVKTAAVDRLTDSSKFTGSHKQRFDSAGRGRGVEGRKDLPDSSGYVSGYANKDTYDKSH